MTPRDIREAEALGNSYPLDDVPGMTIEPFAERLVARAKPQEYVGSPITDDAPDSFRIALHIALSVVICVLLIAVGFAWGSR